MYFIEIAEVVFGILLVVFVFKEVVIPLWKDTKIFPMFRKDRRVVEEELTQVHDEVDLAKLKLQVEAGKKQVRKLTKPKINQAQTEEKKTEEV